MSVNKFKKLNIIENLQENELLHDLTVEESEEIRGGGFPDPPYPWMPAEWGFKLTVGKCDVNEIIGPDGQCHTYYN